MTTTIKSAVLHGVEGRAVTIRVEPTGRALTLASHVALHGITGFALRESRVRVTAALRVVAPELRGFDAYLPAVRDVAALDLPIALAALAAMSAAAVDLSGVGAVGELSLDGSVRPVRGVLASVEALRDAGCSFVLAPRANEHEARTVPGVEIATIRTLREAVDRLAVRCNQSVPTATPHDDMADVIGQAPVKRALEIAAVCGANVILVGPPGAGKSMLARRFSSILPPLSWQESMEVTRIYSAAGILHGGGPVQHRPFRAPHHTISDAGLLGGGSVVRPGEVSLAHNGVLFLDELPEFRRNVIEALGAALRDRSVTIRRSDDEMQLPADARVVAAMNPCPCGYFGDAAEKCRCSVETVRTYLERAAPLIRESPRPTITVQVPAIRYREVVDGTATDRERGESSAAIRERVVRVREMYGETYTRDAPPQSAVTGAIAALRGQRVPTAADRDEARALVRLPVEVLAGV